MKCAAELITIKNEAMAAEYEKMVVNAINFCETTINDEFTRKAKNGEPLKKKYWIGTYEDELGHEFFRFGVHRAHLCSTQPAYAMKPFIDYLHKFCFEVIMSEIDSDGDRELTIYIPKKDDNRTCGV